MKNSRPSGSFAYDSMINIIIFMLVQRKKYQKGTKLYSVNGDKVENVIAVEIVSNSFIKAYSLNYKFPGVK